MRHIWLTDFADLIRQSETVEESAEKIATYVERNAAIALDTPPHYRCPPYCGNSEN